MSGQRKRGFATLDPEQQREIARKGGQAAHGKGTAHEFSSEEARRAGQLGGRAVSANRAHMAEIGRKGGQRTLQREASTRAGQASEKKSHIADMSPSYQSVSSSAVVERLRADHRRVEGLFHEYEQGDPAPATRTGVVQQLCQELLRHTAFEEELVYPIVRFELAESEPLLVHNSEQSHKRIKQLVQNLNERIAAHDSMHDLMDALHICVRDHVQEEEQEILPKLEEHANKELQQLGQLLPPRKEGIDQRTIPESSDDSPFMQH
jgi:uncharacterized protein